MKLIIILSKIIMKNSVKNKKIKNNNHVALPVKWDVQTPIRPGGKMIIFIPSTDAHRVR